MSDIIYRCAYCDADWSADQFTEGCEQCGGGSLQRGCVLCDGSCGAVYNRAVIDSWDTGEAHWVGSCLLSEEKRTQYFS